MVKDTRASSKTVQNPGATASSNRKFNTSKLNGLKSINAKKRILGSGQFTNALFIVQRFGCTLSKLCIERFRRSGNESYNSAALLQKMSKNAY